MLEVGAAQQAALKSAETTQKARQGVLNEGARLASSEPRVMQDFRKVLEFIRAHEQKGASVRLDGPIESLDVILTSPGDKALSDELRTLVASMARKGSGIQILSERAMPNSSIEFTLNLPNTSTAEMLEEVLQEIPSDKSGTRLAIAEVEQAYRAFILNGYPARRDARLRPAYEEIKSAGWKIGDPLIEPDETDFPISLFALGKLLDALEVKAQKDTVLKPDQ